MRASPADPRLEHLVILSQNPRATRDGKLALER
jgi:hypothetical protein